MKLNPGDFIRAILYKPPVKQVDSDGQSHGQVRVQRRFIPNFLVRLWGSFEGISLNSRKVKPHIAKSPSFVSHIKKQSVVPENDATKKTAEYNKSAVSHYCKTNQKVYLNKLVDWKSIISEDKKNPSLQRELVARTEKVAMWLASHDEGLEVNGTLNEVMGNRDTHSKNMLTPDMLHEATNIALHSMIDAEKYCHDTDKDNNAKRFDTPDTRVFPYDSPLYSEEAYPLDKNREYDAKYFAFDNADQSVRSTLFGQWSDVLNSNDS